MTTYTAARTSSLRTRHEARLHSRTFATCAASACTFCIPTTRRAVFRSTRFLRSCCTDFFRGRWTTTSRSELSVAHPGTQLGIQFGTQRRIDLYRRSGLDAKRGKRGGTLRARGGVHLRVEAAAVAVHRDEQRTEVLNA